MVVWLGWMVFFHSIDPFDILAYFFLYNVSKKKKKEKKRKNYNNHKRKK